MHEQAKYHPDHSASVSQKEDPSYHPILDAKQSKLLLGLLQQGVNKLGSAQKRQLSETITKDHTKWDKVLVSCGTVEELLLACHHKLITSIAKKFERKSNLSAQDLVSIGQLGLMEAMRKFDPQKNAKLSTYASAKITNSIQEEVRKSEGITKYEYESLQKTKYIEHACEQVLGRMPTRDELWRQMIANTSWHLNRIEKALALYWHTPPTRPLQESSAFDKSENNAEKAIANASEKPDTTITVFDAQKEKILDILKNAKTKREKVRLLFETFENLNNKTVAQLIGCSENVVGAHISQLKQEGKLESKQEKTSKQFKTMREQGKNRWEIMRAFHITECTAIRWEIEETITGKVQTELRDLASYAAIKEAISSPETKAVGIFMEEHKVNLFLARTRDQEKKDYDAEVKKLFEKGQTPAQIQKTLGVNRQRIYASLYRLIHQQEITINGY